MTDAATLGRALAHIAVVGRAMEYEKGLGKGVGQGVLPLYLARTWRRPRLARRLHLALPSFRLNGSVGVG